MGSHISSLRSSRLGVRAAARSRRSPLERAGDTSGGARPKPAAGSANKLREKCPLQSLNTGARFCMFAVIASVRSWLINMAAFQVAM